MSIQSKRVLVVEDESLVATAIKHMLVRQKYEVVAIASSGEQAIAEVELHRPDIILMDIELQSKMDGIHTAAAIHDTYNIPVIYLTAHSEQRFLERAKITGPYGYLLKPFREDELRIAIEIALYKHQTDQVLQDTNQRLEQEITKRQAIEEELQKSEATLRGIFDSSPNAITMTDLHGTILECNQAAVDMYRCASKSDILGKNALAFIAPTDHERARHNLEDTLRHGILKNIEYTLLTRNRQPFAGELSASVLYDPAGNPKAFVAITRDISEQKKTHERLRQLSTAVEQSPSILVITDIQGNIEYVNPKFTQVTGYTAAEAVGRDPKILNSDKQPQTFYEDLWNTINAGKEWHGDFCNKKKNGELYWESASISAIKNPAGQITHFLKVAEDVTTRKHAEEHIRQQNEFLETILESLSHPFYVIDANDYTIQLANSASGFDSLSKQITCYQLTHSQGFPCDGKHHVCPLDLVKATKEPVVCEHLHYDSHGAPRYMEIHGFPIFDEAGNVTRMIEYALDISDRKKAEEELLQAKESAESANRAKSEFLANMSHELRAPLNGILGYAQLLSRNPHLTESQQKGLDIIQRSGDHLLTLLNDILDLSKIEAGKLEFQPAAFNLARALKSLVEMSRFRAEQKGIAFVYHKDDDLPYVVHGDEKFLRQILLNLLGNAIKFTEQGSVTFRVSSKKYEVGSKEHKIGNKEGNSSFPFPPTSYSLLRFEVKDTGIGIPADHIEAIFSPFEQVKDQRIYTKGTGLGLAISLRLARMMGSELHVESTVNAGSSFWFDVDLPAIERGQPRDKALSQDAPEIEASEAIAAPAPEDLSLLYQMAVIGDIMGIRDQMQRLEQEQPQLFPFVEKIRSFAKELNILGIQQFLQQYLKGEETS
jgi:PAS domain S-box-containing protein